MTTAPDAPRTRALVARAAALEEALARARGQVPARTARRVRAILVGVRQRLELGVDHTVVALAGGTGSGKSSIFNALSGFEFADVGVRRPTTAQVTACVWAHDAELLLAWLGIARDRRIERESALDGDDQADLRGLVLLDLPDHDSIEPEHRAVVDRLLPQVDLLVWVVDPQKYADDALHNRYLKALAGHEGAMIVLLNQVDTLPRDAQGPLMADLERLLAEDGLTGVGVYAASARTGGGIDVLRGALARAVAARGLAEVRAEAELDDAARLLAGTVAPAEPDVAGPATRAAEGLLAAAGIRQSTDALEHAVARGQPGPGRLGPAQPDRVEAVRDRWLDDIGGGLPRLWSRTVAEKLPDTDALTAAADTALAGVRVPVGRPRAATALRVLAALVGVAALVMAGFTAAAVGGGELDLDALRTGLTRTDGAGALAIAAGAAALLALLLIVLARWSRRRVARRRAERLAADGRRALAGVVDDALVSPTVAVLEAHRAVREAAGRHTDPVVRPATRPGAVAPADPASTTSDDDGAPPA